MKQNHKCKTHVKIEYILIKETVKLNGSLVTTDL